MSAVDSVLLIGFGGPERAEDIRPFLQSVTSGRDIPPERIEEVAHHYERIGGRSPLNELTFRQADGLRRTLTQNGFFQPVYVGMRNWHPFLHETLAQMGDEGCRRALGIILSTFQTDASWDRYISDVAVAREKVGPSAPEVLYAPAWTGHPLFIEAMADRVANALAQLAPGRLESVRLLFTAHSVPIAMADRSPYVAQLTAASRAVAEKVGCPRWSVAYQSRSGSPRQPWLEPDICDVLRELAKDGLRDVVAAPIGFVCDHVEVLYDLDVEAQGVAKDLGLCLHRSGTVSDHPRFIEMLAGLVREALAH
jgi:ferrochelatase